MQSLEPSEESSYICVGEYSFAGSLFGNVFEDKKAAPLPQSGQ